MVKYDQVEVFVVFVQFRRDYFREFKKSEKKNFFLFFQMMKNSLGQKNTKYRNNIRCAISTTTVLLKMLILLPVADVLATPHGKTRDTQCFAFIQKKADLTINLLQLNSNHSSSYHYETNKDSFEGESLSTYLLMSQKVDRGCQVWTSNSLQISPNLVGHFMMTQQNIEQVSMAGCRVNNYF